MRIDEVMDHSFDTFDKDPHHRRAMLADASRLPQRTRIKVGPETLDLQVMR